MVKAENIKKRFKLYSKPSDRLKEIILRKPYHKTFEALKGVSFEVKKGETLGIIGPNGAGKSTLLKILMGIILPDEGKVFINGKTTGLLELGTGFNPEMTGEENIYLNGFLIGMSKEEIEDKKKAIIEFSELGDFIYEPIKTYSSGMVMRLGFSIAIHAEPKCFIVDEALSVGDAHFQQKCFRKIREFKESGGSIIFVSHDLNAIKNLCDKAILLYRGEILDEGNPEKVVNSYNYLLAKIEENKDFYIKKEENSYGTYEIFIEKAEVIGEKSKSNIVSSGEKAFVDVYIKSNIDAKDITVGILIRDRFGVDIYGINTHLLDRNISVKKRERYKVRFEVDMNIAPGKYTVTSAIHEGKVHSEKCYHWIDNITSFEVAGFSKYEFAGTAFLPTDVSVEKV